MRGKTLLVSILLIVFVLSMVATVSAFHPRTHVCCTKVLANGTIIYGMKQMGKPDATCSYDLCVQINEGCTCAIIK
jgi:hypothetical protein